MRVIFYALMATLIFMTACSQQAPETKMVFTADYARNFLNTPDNSDLLELDFETDEDFEARFINPIYRDSIAAPFDSSIQYPNYGMLVLASDTGKVILKVTNDDNSTLMKIGHPSGHISWYRNLGTCNVSMNETISRADTVGTMGLKLNFSITKEGG